MGVDRTVALACVLGVATLPLTAAVFGPGRIRLVRRYRPALATMLVGTVLLLAYIVGFTLAVEHGANEARGRTAFPSLVKRCPPFTRADDTGACVVDSRTDVVVPAMNEDGRTYAMARDAFLRSPDGREIARGLMRERAPGLSGRDPPVEEGETDAACAAANETPFTELSTMCPRTDLLNRN